MKEFKVPSTPPTIPKSIRFPIDMIEEIENLIKGKNCTYTTFVLEAVRLALKSLKK